MGRTVRILSALVAGTLAVVVGTPTAHALISSDHLKCQLAIAKEARVYVTKKLKIIQKCMDADLAEPGSCSLSSREMLDALRKLEDKLLAGLAKSCSFELGVTDDNNLMAMGFPGACPDFTGEGFTLDDLQECILSTHDQIFGACGGGTNLGEPCLVLANCPDTGPGTYCHGLLRTEYDPAVVGPLTDTKLMCQKAYARSSGKFLGTLLKLVQKCRNDLLSCKGAPDGSIHCKLSGLSPATCRFDDEKTKRAVDKARDKAIAAISAKCSDQDAIDLGLCDPNQIISPAAATCTIQVIEDLVDNPDPAGPTDLIDYEYPLPGVCGDGRKNVSNEECDGVSDDDDCPGLCGAADGLFPCLCQNQARTRVVEHANADLDCGWTGESHDSGIVEGGGYVTDLWDCDGPLGPDTVCQVGPTCALPPHQACNPARDSVSGSAQNADSICTGAGNFCRKTAGGATGPYCSNDVKKRCKNAGHCGGAPCIITPHGAPLPLLSGGVSVCVVNTFTEDVTGTTDLATGAGEIRLRQNSSTLAGGDTQQPCPVCGGFCSGPGGVSGPGVRTLCDSDDDCGPGSHCVLEPICSYGLDIDQPCHPNAPFGGSTEFFGNPSVDCRPAGSLLGTIDILFDPLTTGLAEFTANEPCNNNSTFNAKECTAGPNMHHTCTVDSECPGGGTCNFQCWCPATGSTYQQPNACGDACLGGPDDANPCSSDNDCTPPGFCHVADCRANPSDTDSFEEGVCTFGPFDKKCSGNTWKPCASDLECQDPDLVPGGSCPFCAPGETCELVQRNCFVWPTIRRQGTPGVPSRVSAATFCIAETSAPAVNTVGGLPGPGAITQPADAIESGF